MLLQVGSGLLVAHSPLWNDVSLLKLAIRMTNPAVSIGEEESMECPFAGSSSEAMSSKVKCTHSKYTDAFNM